jgi:hypothetical protein
MFLGSGPIVDASPEMERQLELGLQMRLIRLGNKRVDIRHVGYYTEYTDAEKLTFLLHQ